MNEMVVLLSLEFEIRHLLSSVSEQDQGSWTTFSRLVHSNVYLDFLCYRGLHCSSRELVMFNSRKYRIDCCKDYPQQNRRKDVEAVISQRLRHAYILYIQKIRSFLRPHP